MVIAAEYASLDMDELNALLRVGGVAQLLLQHIDLMQVDTHPFF